jgi:hypothetical protein
MPQAQGQTSHTNVQASTQPLSQQLAHLGVSDVSRGSENNQQHAATLSALSSFLNSNPPTPTLPPQSLLTDHNNSQAQSQAHQNYLLQHFQTPHTPQTRQLSAPSNLTGTPTSSTSALHGIPLQIVSQHFASRQHGQSTDSTSSGHASGGSGAVSSGNHSGSSPSPQPPVVHASHIQPLDSLHSVTVGGKKLRKKHIVTDRQRRAKIKDGMEQLRSLLSSHGSFTTDQVSIMMASVSLIQKLREEVTALKTHTGHMKAELDRYKQQFGTLTALHPSTPSTSSTSTLLSALGLDATQVAALGDSALTILSAATTHSSGDDSSMNDRKEVKVKKDKDGKDDSSSSASISPPRSSASRSPSLQSEMAAMSMKRSGQESSDSQSSSAGSSGDDSSSPLPPDDDSPGSADTGTQSSEQSEERSTPDIDGPLRDPTARSASSSAVSSQSTDTPMQTS